MTLDDLKAAPCGARLEPLKAGRPRYVKGGTGLWWAPGHVALAEDLRDALQDYRLETGSPSPRMPRR